MALGILVIALIIVAWGGGDGDDNSKPGAKYWG